jgi:hypothetical protein
MAALGHRGDAPPSGAGAAAVLSLRHARRDPGLTPCTPSVPDHNSILKASRASFQYDCAVSAIDQSERGRRGVHAGRVNFLYVFKY